MRLIFWIYKLVGLLHRERGMDCISNGRDHAYIELDQGRFIDVNIKQTGYPLSIFGWNGTSQDKRYWRFIDVVRLYVKERYGVEHHRNLGNGIKIGVFYAQWYHGQFNSGPHRAGLEPDGPFGMGYLETDFYGAYADQDVDALREKYGEDLVLFRGLTAREIADKKNSILRRHQSGKEVENVKDCL